MKTAIKIKAPHKAYIPKNQSIKLHPTTASDIDYSREELEFMEAVQRFKLRTGRQFPTWREVLSILKGMGYHRDGDCYQHEVRRAA